MRKRDSIDGGGRRQSALHLEVGKRCQGVRSGDAIKRARVKPEISEIELHGAHIQIRKNAGGILLELTVQPNVIAIDGVIGAVVAAGERGPIVRS